MFRKFGERGDDANFGRQWYFKTKIVAPKDMDFTPALYFDREDREEVEREALNPTPKATFMQRVWGLKTALIG
jgi:amino acid transporter